MSTFDAFKQYQSEQARIRQKIRDEENPFHALHIQEFNEMMDEKIRTQIPMLIHQYMVFPRVPIVIPPEIC